MPLGLSDEEDVVGEWSTGTLKRAVGWKAPDIKALRARWRGSYRKGRLRCKLSPKQSAKRRWAAKRRRKAMMLLVYRANRGPLYMLMRRMEHNKRYGKEPEQKFSWWERAPGVA